jgi:hypothetical protein
VVDKRVAEVVLLPSITRPLRLVQRNPKFLLILIMTIAITMLFGHILPASMDSSFVVESGRNTVFNVEKHRMTLSDDGAILIESDSELILEAEHIGGQYIFQDKVITTGGDNGHGIEIRNTRTAFIIENCTINGIPVVSAMLLYNVSNCWITDCNITGNGQTGIKLSKVNNATVTKSICNKNKRGIEIIDESSEVELSNITIDSNNHMGIYINSDSIDNDIFWNTLDSNNINGKDDESSTSNNFTQNYWSDYKGSDIDPYDKIGDTPYEILGSAVNEDPEPLMFPADRPTVYWEKIPSNQTREYGSGFQYKLEAAVYGGLDYWWVNDSAFTINDNGVITNDGWLYVGVYNLEVRVYNTYSDYASATFKVTIEDTTLPVWVETPTNQSVEVGDDFYYDVNATDFSFPILYRLENTPNFTINAATGVITNNSSLTIQREYEITVYARDAEYLETSATFTVKVWDSMPPDWLEKPTDQIAEFRTNFIYDLNATDRSGLGGWAINSSLFQIDINGTITNATSLDVGAYALEVLVNDTNGNILLGTFTVHIKDTTPPIWVTWPTNQILEYGHILDIQLEAWDESGISHYTISDTTHFDVTTTGRIFSLVEINQVAYILTVRAYDPYGNYVSSGFSVTVRDTLNPVWNPPLENQIFEFGAPLRIPLRATDASGVTAWSVNETEYFNIDLNGDITNASILAVGNYTLHVSVRDLVGHVLTGTFLVTIRDTTPPIWIDYPREMNVTSTDYFSYQLIANDLSGIAGWELNDTTHFSVDSTGLLENQGLLSTGIYHVSLTVYDPYDNEATVTIMIRVFGLDERIYLLAAGVGASAAFLAVLVILVFHPTRGRFGSWHSKEVDK